MTYKIEIKDGTLRDLTYTLSIARKIDREEVLASGPNSIVEAAYITHYLTMTLGGLSKVVWIDGNPEFAFGFTRQSDLTPWLYSAWAWGSPRIYLAHRFTANWARTDLIPAIIDHGMMRIEARSMAEHTEAHRWLLWMHFDREADLVDWGRDRRRFVLFAWTRTRFVEKIRRGELTSIAAAAARGFFDEEGPSDVLREVQPASPGSAAGDA